ncbi:MAG: hypothetical protein ACHQQR_10075 [Gemmatimonadales bacterium]
MRRSLPFRLFATLLAPWFAVVVAEPVPMHDCPEHSLHPAAVHAMASSHVASAGESGMSGMPHAGMEPSKSGHDHGAPGHTTHHQCCCLGACCAAALAPIARAPQLAWVPAALRSEVALPGSVSFAPSAIEHALPFANAPPAARV